MVDDLKQFLYQASINDERAIMFASGEYLGKDLTSTKPGLPRGVDGFSDGNFAYSIIVYNNNYDKSQKNRE